MASLSSNTRHDERHGGLATDSFAVMAVCTPAPDSRSTRYPARAPRERAILRHASRFGVERVRRHPPQPFHQAAQHRRKCGVRLHRLPTCTLKSVDPRARRGRFPSVYNLPFRLDATLLTVEGSALRVAPGRRPTIARPDATACTHQRISPAPRSSSCPRLPTHAPSASPKSPATPPRDAASPGLRQPAPQRRGCIRDLRQSQRVP